MNERDHRGDEKDEPSAARERTCEGGYWSGRYFRWTMRTHNLKHELSAADMNRMLTRRPRSAEGQRE